MIVIFSIVIPVEGFFFPLVTVTALLFLFDLFLVSLLLLFTMIALVMITMIAAVVMRFMPSPVLVRAVATNQWGVFIDPVIPVTAMIFVLAK